MSLQRRIRDGKGKGRDKEVGCQKVGRQGQKAHDRTGHDRTGHDASALRGSVDRRQCDGGDRIRLVPHHGEVNHHADDRVGDSDHDHRADGTRAEDGHASQHADDHAGRTGTEACGSGEIRAPKARDEAEADPDRRALELDDLRHRCGEGPQHGLQHRATDQRDWQCPCPRRGDNPSPDAQAGSHVCGKPGIPS